MAALLLLVAAVLCVTLGCAGARPYPTKGATFVGAADARISYIGRVDTTSAAPAVMFDWPCVSANFAVSNTTTISAHINGGHNRFAILVNGSNPAGTTASIETGDSLEVVTLLTGLDPAAVHNITVLKITEASYFVFEPLLPLKVVTLEGFELAPAGAAMLPWDGQGRGGVASSSRRKIEVFGDSDSNGFGILGPSPLCDIAFETFEDCQFSYTRLLAEAFDADLHVEAWSGKGVVKNAVGFERLSSDPMPIYLNRTLATEASGALWDFQAYVPDLLIVYLGSNDYYFPPTPTEAEFVDGYVALLEQAVGYWGDTAGPTVVSVCGGLSKDNEAPCDNIVTAIKAYAAKHPTAPEQHYIHINGSIFNPDTDFGCIGHRDLAGQAKLAAYLQPPLAKIMGW